MSSIWGSRRSHKYLGKLSDIPAKMSRKCALKVRIVRSAMLQRWTSGGDELELCPPLLLDVVIVGCAAFVFKDLEVNTMAVLCEAGHDPICGGANGSTRTTLMSKW